MTDSALLNLVLGSLLFAFSCWKVFEKAGYKGWASLVPIYNVYVLFKVSGSPGWWTVLALIPLVNIVVLLIAGYRVAKRFGKDTKFAVACALFGFIFLPILGFGKAEYQAAPAA